MKTLRYFLKAALIILFIASPAYAFRLDIGADTVDGVNDKISASLELEQTWEMEHGEADLDASFDYSEVNDETDTNDGYLRAGYDPAINDRWSLWFFDQVGYDRPSGIEVENFIGGGPKYLIYRNEKFKTSFSTGLLYHHERFLDDTSDDIIRLSNRLKFRYLKDALGITTVVFYQPDVEETDDYIVSSTAAFTYRLNGRFGLSYTFEYEYRSLEDPPKEVTNTLSLSVYFEETDQAE